MSNNDIWIRDLKHVNMILFADVQSNGKVLTSKHTATDIRNYIRSLFAFVEGSLFNLRRILVNTKQDVLTAEEFVILKETSLELSDNGSIQERVKFYTQLPMLRFTFATFARCYGSPFQLPVTEHGWKQFRDAVNIRNRITHPKSANDLLISDAEHATIIGASEWFARNLKDMLTSCVSP